MNYTVYTSPLGLIEIKEQDDCLTNLSFVTEPSESQKHQASSTVLKVACRQLDEYFTGKRKYFDLPLAPKGTDFQQKIWHELQKIDYGTTKTYADIAAAIGNTKACRAVGQANNKNPIAIIIPCHRVIGKSGNLIGYAAGIALKQKLLDLEKRYK